MASIILLLSYLLLRSIITDLITATCSKYFTFLWHLCTIYIIYVLPKNTELTSFACLEMQFMPDVEEKKSLLVTNIIRWRQCTSLGTNQAKIRDIGLLCNCQSICKAAHPQIPSNISSAFTQIRWSRREKKTQLCLFVRPLDSQTEYKPLLKSLQLGSFGCCCWLVGWLVILKTAVQHGWT